MKNSMKYLIIGIVLFLAIALVGILLSSGRDAPQPPEEPQDTLITVTCATGGGKENFLADPEIIEILEKEYGIRVEHIAWSNGRISDKALAEDTAHQYDAVFFSDERFYEQYSKANNQTYKRQKGYIALKTPIVIYSWPEVAEVLAKEEIVTVRDGIHYISGMQKLLTLIDDEVKWRDITEPGSAVYSNPNAINIASVDPEKSSPGITYYGLLAAIIDPANQSGSITDETMARLRKYYIKSGFMGTAPIDLFNKYLMMGIGAYPLIVDYEKSLIDWAVANPSDYNALKNRIVTLYPEPTIWNSHCIISFTENGSIYVDALEKNERIHEIAFEKYGFRMGVSTGKIAFTGIPEQIYSVVPALRMEGYDRIMEAVSGAGK